MENNFFVSKLYQCLMFMVYCICYKNIGFIFEKNPSHQIAYFHSLNVFTVQSQLNSKICNDQLVFIAYSPRKSGLRIVPGQKMNGCEA